MSKQEKRLPAEPSGIQELIVVEGKNDAHVIRRALGPVDILWTEGFGLTEEKLQVITEMAKRKGVILCTDPDFPGQQIRQRIEKRVPGVKHVYLPRKWAISPKGDDIGVENASLEHIRTAFAQILAEVPTRSTNAIPQSQALQREDLVGYGLVGQAGSAARRYALGQRLGIGDTNAKQFLHRVNRFGLGREEVEEALTKLEKEES